MFRFLVIAVTLIGMTMCQYRCMGAEAASQGLVVAGCPCCHPPQEIPAPNDAPEPCCPGHDGDCHCQGVCGGAVMGETSALDGLILAWSVMTVPIAAACDAADLASGLTRYDDEPPARGAPDGRALRILIASLLT